MGLIPHVTIERVTQGKNNKADALAKLAMELVNPNEKELLVST